MKHYKFQLLNPLPSFLPSFLLTIFLIFSLLFSWDLHAEKKFHFPDRDISFGSLFKFQGYAEKWVAQSFGDEGVILDSFQKLFPGLSSQENLSLPSKWRLSGVKISLVGGIEVSDNITGQLKFSVCVTSVN